MSTVTRFAPSPTGNLHLGHAYSALFAFDAARDTGGAFKLRIEDIDQTRCRPEFEQQIEHDLTWLGLVWETPVRRQSEHFDDYRKALHTLAEQGLCYPCFCTRKEIEAEIDAAGGAPHGPDGALYPGTCLHLDTAERQGRIAAGEPHAVRLDMQEACHRSGPLSWLDRGLGKRQARPEQFGDVVLARKDTPTSYHLAVTVDDHLQGITLVTRAIDLAEATDVHRLLQHLLGLDQPEYHHHALLHGADGKRFAKRDKSKTLESLRSEGATPDDIRQMIAGFTNV
ncbi:MAG: tRNA glutamyl-Q(34) synthetase GluQRS [Rhodospirillales bacterium]